MSNYFVSDAVLNIYVYFLVLSRNNTSMLELLFSLCRWGLQFSSWTKGIQPGRLQGTCKELSSLTHQMAYGH